MNTLTWILIISSFIPAGFIVGGDVKGSKVVIFITKVTALATLVVDLVLTLKLLNVL